jgi:hypothetical protein
MWRRIALWFLGIPGLVMMPFSFMIYFGTKAGHHLNSFSIAATFFTVFTLMKIVEHILFKNPRARNHI